MNFDIQLRDAATATTAVNNAIALTGDNLGGLTTLCGITDVNVGSLNAVTPGSTLGGFINMTSGDALSAFNNCKCLYTNYTTQKLQLETIKNVLTSGNKTDTDYCNTIKSVREIHNRGWVEVSATDTGGLCNPSNTTTSDSSITAANSIGKAACDLIQSTRAGTLACTKGLETSIYPLFQGKYKASAGGSELPIDADNVISYCTKDVINLSLPSDAILPTPVISIPTLLTTIRTFDSPLDRDPSCPTVLFARDITQELINL